MVYVQSEQLEIFSFDDGCVVLNTCTFQIMQLNEEILNIVFLLKNPRSVEEVLILLNKQGITSRDYKELEELLETMCEINLLSRLKNPCLPV